MPYKSEKIRLAENQDRRRKLTQEQKDEIVALYATGKHSLRSLGRQFGVDRTYMKILVNPDRAETVKNRIKEHWHDYVPSKEQRNEIMREHRQYKHSLYLKGELRIMKCNDCKFCVTMPQEDGIPADECRNPAQEELFGTWVSGYDACNYLQPRGEATDNGEILIV
ncbi:MAG: hypothetical protein LBQ15_10995 [Clostridium sp.]|jgi:transposase-like protein|nr:hypothetical protein [Clostridium sp.]